MNKSLCVVYAPVNCYSGYSSRSRDFVKSLIKIRPDWDIKIISCRWGNTRQGFLEDYNEQELLSRIIPNLSIQPDIFIAITIPSEFQKIGKYNIGVTAGIETTMCDPSWIQGVNNMDLVLVSSHHAKNVFEKTSFEVKDNRTGQIINSLKLNTKVDVLFEGLDTTQYFKTPVDQKCTLVKDIDKLDDNFLFLCTGHWMKGNLGHDRKNIALTVKSFLETFKNKNNPPALLLKTHQVTTSYIDQQTILSKIDLIRNTVRGKLPNIYLLHGEISDKEMNQLYNHPKVKAMISLTKGEGFGRPLLEFSAVGKPIIVSGWSGQTDFLDNKFVRYVSGSLEKVDESAVVDKTILKEAQWFSPSPGEIGVAYREVFNNYKKWQENAKRQKYKTTTEFTIEKMENLLDNILQKNIPDIPKFMELKLPKLTKVD